MTKNNPALAAALAATRLYTDDIEYAVLRLAPTDRAQAAQLLARGGSFGVLIIDKDEITVVVQAAALADTLPQGAERAAETYRLITFDIELPPTLTGYMAHLSAVLAEAGVPIFPLAAYSRDHLLVPSGQFALAWRALENTLKT